MTQPEKSDRIMLGHNRRMTGAECLADMLAGYGVTHVFMVPAVLRRTFAEMERRTKIARVHCHGEKSAAYMADGYARASGKPGICMAQVIGALNLAAGLRDAYLAHSPVIAFTGGHPLSVGVVGSYSRESANRAVNRADLVCFIGSETGGMTTHFWTVPKIGTAAIQIDIEPESLGRNYPLQASVLGD